MVGAVQVEQGDEFMMITNAGTLVRTRVGEVSQVGRNTQGVTLIRTSEDEKVVGLQRIEEPDEVLVDLDDAPSSSDEASTSSVDEGMSNTVQSDPDETDEKSE